MQDYLDAMSQYRGAAQLEQNIETAKQIGMEYVLKWDIPGESLSRPKKYWDWNK